MKPSFLNFSITEPALAIPYLTLNSFLSLPCLRRGLVDVERRNVPHENGARRLFFCTGRGERPAGRAQLLANFVHELDDVWLGSGNRPGAVVPPS